VISPGSMGKQGNLGRRRKGKKQVAPRPVRSNYSRRAGEGKKSRAFPKLKKKMLFHGFYLRTQEGEKLDYCY